jgi:hypothetical protein
MFQLCVYTSYRPNESFVPKQQGKCISVLDCDKNLQQRINIEFCVIIGKSVAETLDLLRLAYGERDMKTSRVIEWSRRFKRARKCARWPKKWAAENTMDRCKCGQSTNLGELRSKIRSETTTRRTEYGDLFRNTGLTSRFSTLKMLPSMIR